MLPTYTLKYEVIDRYMYCIRQNYKKCTGLHILNLGHCVELAVLEGKFGFLNLFHFESESESRFNSDENCF